MSTKLVEGNPREPEPVPLDNAEELGIHRVLDENGEPKGDLPDPGLPREDLQKMYETMVLLRALA